MLDPFDMVKAASSVCLHQTMSGFRLIDAEDGNVLVLFCQSGKVRPSLITQREQEAGSARCHGAV